MNRLFVFGCSFTSYIWPTWADMLSFEFDYYENWGLAGAGNRAIAERVAECHAKNCFTEKDTVIVQWSSHIRSDWYSEDIEEETNQVIGWAVSRIKGETPEHKKLFDQIYSEKAYIMHTLNMIKLTQSLLKESKCNWLMTSLGDIRNLGYDNIFSKRPNDEFHVEEVTQHVLWKEYPEFNIYKSIWDSHESYWISPIFPVVLKNRENIWKFSKDNYIDFHPTPYHHNIWINNYLKPKLSINYKHDDIRNKMVENSNKLKNKTDYGLDDFSVILDRMFVKMFETLPLNYPELEKKTGF